MYRKSVIWPVWVVMLAAISLEVLPLPGFVQPLRPPWAAIAVIYWTMMWPRRFGLGAAWVVGIILDILHGTLLGENAIALSIVAYVTMRFHLQIRIFPMWQLTTTVFALLTINAFIQFWIDGVAGVGSAGISRWTQVMTGAILWPPLMALMDRVRVQIETRGTAFI